MKEFNLDGFRNTRIPSEAEIMSTWLGDITKPVVSVVCLTYNQEKYIEDAIRGFLIQKTNFPFEIIIHDDASTDLTAFKVLEYAKKYPKIIKPIIQKDNQYSKQQNSVIFKAAEVAAGTYIALCEGDDFWIVIDKLQRQLDLMQRNPKVKICFHKNFQGSTDSGKVKFRETLRSKLLYPRREVIISTKIIILGDGGYMHTASIMATKELISNLPEWFNECSVGDYFIQIIGSVKNGAAFIPEAMSFYRMFSVGSWSSREKTPESQYFFLSKMQNSLQNLNNELREEYEKEITLVRDEFTYGFWSRKDNLKFLNRTTRKFVGCNTASCMGVIFVSCASYLAEVKRKQIKLKRYLIVACHFMLHERKEANQ